VSKRSDEFGGLVVNDDYVRNYPNGQLLAHVLGYTGAVTQEELDGGITHSRAWITTRLSGRTGWSSPTRRLYAARQARRSMT
jgi:cell division protein FtsI/penicillin-binding protein 2